MRKGAIALLDDKHLHALKVMTPHKNGRLTESWMEPVVDFSLGIAIPGSMSLLRRPQGRLYCEAVRLRTKKL
jgi:hypothetical protein